MDSVLVKASRCYQVLVGPGLLDEAGERIREAIPAEKAVIVSGPKAGPLYAPRLQTSLEAAGFRVLRYVHPGGEGAKSLAEYGRLLRFLAENRVNRGDVLVALGGGVTGDLTGFAASTYQRGMGFVQVPTTLLAAVDSSVGGKTAVDLASGKNQVGTFYQPWLVLCDTGTLNTLPEEEYRCGCAEVIKYGVLGSAALFRQLEEKPVKEQAEHVIARCVEMKRDIVGEDEFDTGRRRLLNLGHSIGHAIEACSGFTVPHGQAVAVGLAVICRAAYEKGLCFRNTAEAVEALLERYGLPTKTGYTLDELCAAALSDKKFSGGVLHLVVPREIGRCEILPVPAEEIRGWMQAGGIA